VSLQFGGLYTPERPVILDPSGYGPGTPYPIQWKRYASGTSSDQDDIVRAQWLMNKILITVNGTATMNFLPPGGIGSAEQHDVDFALSVELTATITGADASCRYPSVLDIGDAASFTGGDDDTITVSTTWGDRDVQVQFNANVGTSFLGIESDDFVNLRKAIEITFQATAFNVDNVNTSVFVDTSTLGGTTTPLGEDCNPMFHDSTPLYYTADTDCSVTFSEFSVVRTDELAVP